MPRFFPSLLLCTIAYAETPVPDTIRHNAEKPSWAEGADKLPAFPKPAPGKTFSELSLKILQPDGFAFRKPREDWQGARIRISTIPEWTAWLAKRQQYVDKWMNRHCDRTEWKAGWWHDFVSPKDGSFLVWTEEIPGEQVDHFTSLSGHRVEITPKLFAAWVMKFREKHLAVMVESARLYQLTGDTRYAEWTAGQIDFYAGNYAKWPIQTGFGNFARFGCQSLEDATWLIQWVETARLLFGYAEPQRRQAWFQNLFKPQCELLNRSFQIIHNIATWHRSAQTQVALLYKDSELWAQAVDAPYGLRAQLRRGVTSDYFWYEQSLGYNNYVINAVVPTLVVAGLTGQRERLLEEAALLQNMMISPITLRFPDGNGTRLPCPADAHFTPHVQFSDMARAARVLPTTIGIDWAGANLDWSTLVDPLERQGMEIVKTNTDVGAHIKNLSPVVSRNMESSRFALLKQGPWQVFYHYGQLAKSHSQSEALNWSAAFGKTDISHDPGTTGYGSPMTNYFRHGLNHNVPLIGGMGQYGWNPGRLIHFDPGTETRPASVTAEQPDYRPGVAARRTLRIENKILVEETTLDFSRNFSASGNSKRSELPGIVVQLQGTPRLPSIFAASPTFQDNRPAVFRFWENVRSAIFSQKAELDVMFSDGLVVRLEISCPGKFTLYQGSTPDSPPLRRTGFFAESLMPATPGTSVKFVTRLIPLTQPQGRKNE